MGRRSGDEVAQAAGSGEQVESAVTTTDAQVRLQRDSMIPVFWQENTTTKIEVLVGREGQRKIIEGGVERRFEFEVID